LQLLTDFAKGTTRAAYGDARWLDAPWPAMPSGPWWTPPRLVPPGSGASREGWPSCV